MTTEATYLRAPLAHIEWMGDNPRSTFDDIKLTELASTIKAHGVIVPIIVRPHPGQNGTPYQGVAGERRWRAAELAGMTDIPVVVQDLTDKEVAERQLIENSQREGLHELDEAEAYQKLLDNHEYTMDDLVSKTGRSKAHLYGRLKLLSLCHEGKQALVKGKLSAASAELIARQDKKVQPEILTFALGLKAFADYDVANIAPEGIGEEGKNFVDDDATQPLSFRALQALIHRKYTLRLADAPFPTYDELLVPEAGACTTCPHRTGNQPELFPDLKKPADSCTKPVCFEAKVQARWDRAAQTAKDTNVKILPAKEAKDIFTHDGKPAGTADYIDPEQPLPYDLAKPGSNATWGKLLGKAAGQVPKVLVRDERGAPRELLDKKAAIKLLRDAGKLDEASKRSADPAEKEQRAKDKAKRDIRSEAFKRVLVTVGQGAADFNLAGPRTLPMLRWFALGILENCKYGAEQAVLELVPETKDGEVNASERIAAAIKKATTPGQVLGIAACLLVAGCQDAIVGEWSNQDDAEECFEDACKIFGADWSKALATAKDAAKAQAKVDAAKSVKKHGGCNAKTDGGACVLPRGHSNDHAAAVSKAPKAKKAGAK